MTRKMKKDKSSWQYLITKQDSPIIKLSNTEIRCPGEKGREKVDLDPNSIINFVTLMKP